MPGILHIPRKGRDCTAHHPFLLIVSCSSEPWLDACACVLLQRKDELMLSEHFAEGLRRVRRKLSGAPLHIVNFDWHGTMNNLKEKGTVEGLWAILAAILPQVT